MTTRVALRGAAGTMAVGLVVLWVFLVRYLYLESQGQPAPAVLMLPLFFFSLAGWGFVAALRDEPIILIVSGGLSLVPLGIFFLFMPSFVRWIGLLDLGLIAVGMILLWIGEEEGGLQLADPGP